MFFSQALCWVQRLRKDIIAQMIQYHRNCQLRGRKAKKDLNSYFLIDYHSYQWKDKRGRHWKNVCILSCMHFTMQLVFREHDHIYKQSLKWYIIVSTFLKCRMLHRIVKTKQMGISPLMYIVFFVGIFVSLSTCSTSRALSQCSYHLAAMFSCSCAKDPQRWSLRKAFPWFFTKLSMLWPHQLACL